LMEKANKRKTAFISCQRQVFPIEKLHFVYMVELNGYQCLST